MRREDKILHGFCLVRRELVWGMVILIFVLLLGNGIFWCRYADAAKKEGTAEENLEAGDISYEYKEQQALKSKVEDQEDCYLCGNNSRSLMGMFRNYDDLGIVSVNHWYVEQLRIRSYDDAGNLTGSTGSINVLATGTGEGGDSFFGTFNGDRGFSNVTVDYGTDSILDVDKARKCLCQKCLDKMVEVMEVYGPEGKEAEPRDLFLVDFQTLELYSLQEHHTGYLIRDYYVSVRYEEDQLCLLAVYVPVLENGEKE